MEILVVSDEHFHNHTLSYFLQEKLRISSAHVYPREIFNTIKLCQQGGHKEKNQKKILLWDYKHNELDDLWLLMKTVREGNLLDWFYVCVYNMVRNSSVEADLLNHKVRGVLYENYDLDMFIKAVKCIVAGELWFSRNTLKKYILEEVFNQQPKECTDAQAVSLTARELEILMQIYAGKSNQQIADDLCICTSTVKTHLYKIFRKIDVPNRIQAALWTAKYLNNGDS